jgi:hypothetical protein
MMTRKDYVAVSEILSSYRNEMDRDSFQDLVNDFSDLFFTDNPNFSPNRFELACFAETTDV